MFDFPCIYRNLSGNPFTGQIPDALLKKANSGLLTLRFSSAYFAHVSFHG